MMPAIRSCGVTSKAGCRTGTPSGRISVVAHHRHLGAAALFDRDGVAVRRREVQRRERRGHEERDAVARSQHGHRVGADLVRGVAVRGDAIGAHDDHVDLTLLHQMAGHAVGDHRHRDRVLLQFPRGEARALQERPRLVGEHVRDAPRLEGGAHDTERGAVARRRERAGVAVGEDARVRRDHIETRAPDRAADLDVLGDDALRRGDQPGAHDRRIGAGRVGRLARALRACGRDPRTGSPPWDASGRGARSAVSTSRRSATVDVARLVVAASATPSAAAQPIAGAPRTTIVSIACATSSTAGSVT